jgi:hypothetical protein
MIARLVAKSLEWKTLGIALDVLLSVRQKLAASFFFGKRMDIQKKESSSL